MVTKKRAADDKAGKKGRVRLGKLKLNRETVRDLTGDEKRKIKGGATNNCNGGDGIAKPLYPHPTAYCNGGQA